VLGTRSITCIDIHSEPYPSVSMVPGFCRARFDCRFGPDDTDESLVALLSGQAAVWSGLERRPTLDVRVFTAAFDTYTGQHYDVPEFAASWYTPVDAPLVQRCLAGLAGAGLPAEIATYGFCTNGSLTAGERGVPTVGYGVGREEDAHTVDESIALENLFRGARGYADMVRALLATGSR
jgi:acetylornithine deacetylase/succinyl-diaminopimelate desuccinylase-like protein